MASPRSLLQDVLGVRCVGVAREYLIASDFANANDVMFTFENGALVRFCAGDQDRLSIVDTPGEDSDFGTWEEREALINELPGLITQFHDVAPFDPLSLLIGQRLVGFDVDDWDELFGIYLRFTSAALDIQAMSTVDTVPQIPPKERHCESITANLWLADAVPGRFDLLPVGEVCRSLQRVMAPDPDGATRAIALRIDLGASPVIIVSEPAGIRVVSEDTWRTEAGDGIPVTLLPDAFLDALVGRPLTRVDTYPLGYLGLWFGGASIVLSSDPDGLGIVLSPWIDRAIVDTRMKG